MHFSQAPSGAPDCRVLPSHTAGSPAASAHLLPLSFGTEINGPVNLLFQSLQGVALGDDSRRSTSSITLRNLGSREAGASFRGSPRSGSNSECLGTPASVRECSNRSAVDVDALEPAIGKETDGPAVRRGLRTAAAVRSTPTHHAGKRAQRFNASTSDHAFWLWRISCGVWCRVTDVASRKPLVDAGIVRIRASAVSRRAEPAADGRQDWPAQVAGIFERSSTGNTLCTRPLRPSATSKAATRGESRHHV